RRPARPRPDDRLPRRLGLDGGRQGDLVEGGRADAARDRAPAAAALPLHLLLVGRHAALHARLEPARAPRRAGGPRPRRGRVLPPPVTGALDGVRVLDLSDQQGAFAGKLLAGLGADVVLVEPPGGSPLRSIPPFWQGVEGPERSLFFWFYSAGKRGITLDWRTAAGAATLRRLAARADVLIESEAPGTLAGLGCGSAALRAANPRLVVASITPFGQTGPYRAWRASDTVA